MAEIRAEADRLRTRLAQAEAVVGWRDRWRLERQSIAPGWEPDPQPVTSSLLRKLNISSIIDDTKQNIAGFYDFWARLDEETRSELLKRADELRTAARASKRGGRTPLYGPDHYAKVAGVYTAAFAAGLAPTSAVADRWLISRSQAAKWVAHARKLEFLPATVRGKAKGRSTNDERKEP
jgi:hypothetical protein